VVSYRESFGDTLKAMGERARQLRLIRKIRQSELSERAGVGLMTIRRFEQTGVASSENVLRIATALDAEAAFDALFAPPPYGSLDEALARPALIARRRAPRQK